jgi:hypothetical protein
MKKCGRCGEVKELSEFGKSKQTSDGLRCYCKTCKRIESAAWRENNLGYGRKYRQENRDELIEFGRKYYRENKEELYKKKRIYLDSNPEVKAADASRKKAWYEANKQRVIDRKRERRQSNVQLRMAENLRVRLYNAIKHNSKVGSAVSDLGCTMEEFKAYIENKFVEGMTWENYGQWHLDHIIPISSFDLTDYEQVKKACHYTNLQPLWALDNLKKGDKISPIEEK